MSQSAWKSKMGRRNIKHMKIFINERMDLPLP